MAIYGTPQYHVGKNSTDRIGIWSLVIWKFWQPERWPMTMSEIDEAAPPEPEIPGGLLLVGYDHLPVRGGFRTQWSYEGVHGDGKGVTFKTRETSYDYDFQGGFSQVDVALHPKLQKLLDEFQGTALDGEIIFPPTVAGADVGGNGFEGFQGTGLSGDSGEAKPNKMYGQKDFFRTDGVYSFRYAAFNDSGLKAGVNQVHKSSALPGKAPNIDGRDWLKMMPSFRRRGVVLDVTETYWLSGEGGWPKELYGK